MPTLTIWQFSAYVIVLTCQHFSYDTACIFRPWIRLALVFAIEWERIIQAWKLVEIQNIVLSFFFHAGWRVFSNEFHLYINQLETVGDIVFFDLHISSLDRSPLHAHKKHAFAPCPSHIFVGLPLNSPRSLGLSDQLGSNIIVIGESG